MFSIKTGKNYIRQIKLAITRYCYVCNKFNESSIKVNKNATRMIRANVPRLCLLNTIRSNEGASTHKRSSRCCMETYQSVHLVVAIIFDVFIQHMRKGYLPSYCQRRPRVERLLAVNHGVELMGSGQATPPLGLRGAAHAPGRDDLLDQSQ